MYRILACEDGGWNFAPDKNTKAWKENLTKEEAKKECYRLNWKTDRSGWDYFRIEEEDV